ncbi:CDP-Glycerol:Poly(glycerophosphate) glycerophosphotransferase [Brevibacterium iodinum ATCC 49514]|uniref:CDP-Glycerol:Poly(Glycerophosphate) glycerophosphotransferase n=1 Tax=Brevibacterium iodinum ATCC 49514 TaxID=1255616 RepID=A0A2H1HQY7_9MICO|nr:CDP-glycerol glycerophosphotransferase family protein [Brevibacterium iodinum]SMX65311.1 CDP-Glycerol:Poly(glycerophosphate) glycerophosphotransferase [Brevibacterium iodinum ATCC 49514]SUW13429.1 CDP-Glycerol:Poly(glycerophosphate) glycerophosphotransferase [Brevibacterium iodinum]
MANPVRWVARTALRSSAWKRTSKWIRGAEKWNRLEDEYDGSYVKADVVVYFGDRSSKFYQLEQWIPVLEELHKEHRVVIVVRKGSALTSVLETTHLPVVFKRRFDPLQTFYHANDFKLALYVNNGMTNFQSLSFAPMVHVHVNHGESDKLSMVSNQAKAYDKVFIAGEAAVERHRRALIDFDESQLVRVGRPQLDIERPLELEPSSARTIMYAPTWEGENDANNYTSVDRFGPQIVEAALRIPGARLIYKPHPRVETSKDPYMVEANARILNLIEAANASIDDETLQHQVLMQGDILGMFDTVDLLITDISSVGLDFLYLHPDKPLVLTDRRGDTESLNAEAPISRAAPLINDESIGSVESLLKEMLVRDSSAEIRHELRRHYFGDGEPGSSTVLFTEAVSRLIADRTAALQSYHTESVNAEADDE